MNNDRSKLLTPGSFLIIAVTFLTLTLISWFCQFFPHLMVDLFAIMVSGVIFFFYWNSRRNLKKSEESLRKSQHELTIRNTIADLFLTMPDDRMYAEVLQIILKSLKSKHGLFAYINQAGDLVFASLTREIWEQCRMEDKKAISPRQAWSGMWGEALLTPKTICSNNPGQVPEGHIPIQRVLIVPIVYQAESIGVIMVANKETDYTKDDQALLEAIADSKIAPILYTRLQRDNQEEERQQAEKSIKDALAELDQVFNTVADGMRIVNKDFQILRINKTFASLVGLPEKEIVGKKCYEIFPGSACHTDLCSLFRILGGQEKIEYDSLKHRPDGLPVPCLVTATPFRGPNGELIGIVEDYRDITMRKKMEEALLEAKEEAEIKCLALIEQAIDGVIIIQEEILKFANKTMTTILGYFPEEIIGKSCWEIVAQENLELIQDRYHRRLAGEGVPSFYEAKFQGKSGLIKEVEISSGLIQYHGQPAIMTIVRDITDRKKMEEELTKTQKLESLGILAGGIAHDFKNILVSIIGSISLAKLHLTSGDKVYEILDRAAKASHRAKDLTQQLLTFSRGGAPIKKITSISNLLTETASFAMRGAKVKGDFHLPAALWSAEVDETQISQVINNLIINAEQAMPKGGLITVKAENITLTTKNNTLPLKPGDYVKIMIADQGIGIPEHNLEKMFLPYFTTKPKGTGLGLATVFSIIKRHEGHITVSSQLGTGTVFTFYLPALRKTSEEIEVKERQICSAGQGRILFMDDEESVRETAGDILTYLGYSVEFAEDGLKAIDLYLKAKEAGRPFDAVILDLTIPGGMGGKEAMERLQEIDPEVKAIVSSGYSNAAIMSEFKTYGFCGVIPKPYEVKDLTEAVHKVIKGPEQRLLEA